MILVKESPAVEDRCPPRDREPTAASSAPDGVAQRARRAGLQRSAPAAGERVERSHDLLPDWAGERPDHATVEFDHELSAMCVERGHDILPGEAAAHR